MGSFFAVNAEVDEDTAASGSCESRSGSTISRVFFFTSCVYFKMLERKLSPVTDFSGAKN